MKQFPAAKIRNVALVGHQESGKTMLSESLLFSAGAIPRLGRVEDGNTTMDYHPEELARGISIHSGVAHCEHEDVKINIIDTPGYEDFVGDVLLATGRRRGRDRNRSARMPASKWAPTAYGEPCRSTAFPPCSSPTGWTRSTPTSTIASNKLHEHFGAGVHALQLPIGVGDIVPRRRGPRRDEGLRIRTRRQGHANPSTCPPTSRTRAEELRKELMESAAESDEALMEKYLETEALTEEEFRTGLTAGIRAAEIFPVLCASPLHNMGAMQILDAIVRFLPSAQTGIGHTTDEKDIACDAAGNPVAYVFKNISDPHVGDMLVVRVFRGALTPGLDVHNTTRNSAERLGQLFRGQGKNREEVSQSRGG